MNIEIQTAILEGIWLMRWNKEETALTAVLTKNEALKMCEDIIEELDHAGFKIVEK